MTFKQLVIKVGFGFNPSNVMSDYVERNGSPSYDGDELDELQGILDLAKLEHGEDIYDVTEAIFKEMDEVRKIARLIW